MFPLNDGLSARALTMADVAAAAAILQADEVDLLGSSYVSADDLQAVWQRPSVDLSSTSAGVWEDVTGRLIAYAAVYRPSWVEVAVHPDHRGRGLGTALLRWTIEAVRPNAPGLLAGQSYPAVNTAATALLLAHGFEREWTAWILERRWTASDAAGARHGEPHTELRALHPHEAEMAYQVVEDAFNEWPGREPSSFADWSASHLERPDHEPWQVQVLLVRGEIVGVASLAVSDGDAWVEQLAVRRSHRGLGLGRRLLTGAFDEFCRRGHDRVLLSTDSRTGALGLYLHVGMTIKHEFVHLSKRFD